MNTSLRPLATLTLLAVATTASAGVTISISSRIQQITDTVFEGIGIDFDIDLPVIEAEVPERAASAVNNAFDRADRALNDVFGEGGTLDDLGIDFPNVDQIVSDAVGDANQFLNGLDLPTVNVPQVAALNVQEIVDDALGQANSVLDGLDLPSVDIPQVTIPSVEISDVQQIVDDAIGRANEVLDELDLPNVEAPTVDAPDIDQIVEDALNDAQQAVDDALDGAQDAVDDALDNARDLLDELDGVVPEVETILDDVLGESGVVEEVLADLPVELPPAAVEALESLPVTLPFSLGSTFLSSGPLVTASAVAVPEPASALLLALAAGFAPRRRR